MKRRFADGPGRQADIEQQTPKVRKRSSRRLVFMVLLTLAVIAAVFFYVIPKFASYKSVFQAMGHLGASQLVLLFALAIFNLACGWTVNQASLPGMRNWQAGQMMLSQNLIASTLPLGGAWSMGLGYQISSSYGFGLAEYSMMLTVSGVWNTLARLALPIAALVLLLVAGKATAGMVALTMVGLGFLVVTIVVFVLILWKRTFAIRTGIVAGKAMSWVLHLFHRGPVTNWGAGLSRFRDQTVEVAKSRWLVLTLLAVVYQLSTFAVCLMALRFSGVPAHGHNGVTWVAAFGVFAFVRLISAIPVTPGAVGISEASYTAMLVAVGGSKPEVVAGVLLFRGLTWVMPIVLGLPAYGTWLLRDRLQRLTAQGAGTIVDSLSEEEA